MDIHNNITNIGSSTQAQSSAVSTPSVSSVSNVLLNIDIKLLEKIGMSYEEFCKLTPEEQQGLIKDINGLQEEQTNFGLTGLSVEINETKSHVHDGEHHPEIPSKTEWKKMSADERLKFLQAEVDYHLDELGVPKDQRKAVFRAWLDARLIEKRGITQEKWNSFSEERKQKIRERDALSFETAIKNGYTKEDYAAMSEYTRVYNEAKVAQEKIANGEKVTKAEVVAANKGKLIESLDEIDSKYSKQERTEPNFFEKYEKEVQDALVGLQHSKGTAAYKRQELLEWKKAFFKAYDEAPEGKKESVVAGLTDEQRLLCLSIITNNKFCDDTKLKEILQNFGVKVEDVRFLAKACENGQVNSENFANYAAAACSVHEDNFKQDPDSDKVTDSRNAMREIAENFGTLGSDATKVYDSMYCSSDDEVVDTAASNIYRMDKSSQDYATDKINQNDNAEKAKHHASLALNAANEVNAHDSLLNIQKGFNSGNNESTRQATIEFTANIKDAEIQDLFDKNNFEATEALEDKEMAARLHQLRIDEMPKWDVKVQESAFQRTMDSKYSEIRDYAAKNISRLDPTVQKAALDTVYNSRNNQAAEKTITVALQQTEKMPAVVQQEEIARIVLEEISVTAPKESDDFIKKYSNGELSRDEISKLSAADRKKYYDVMFKKASFSDKIKMLKNVSGNNAKYIFNMLCRYGDTALITNMVLSEGMGADIIKSGVAPDVRNKIVSILKRSSSNEAISQVDELRSDKSYAALFEDYTFGQNSKIEIKS